MFRWLALGAVSLLLIADAIGESGTIAPAQCTGLAKLALPDTKIVREEVVAPGSFLPPNTAQGPDYKSLPAFCRVIAEATPTPDSDIKMEIWLPVSGWNGKFRGQGNGGFAGEIDYSMLGASLSQGYATAGTDTGHAASGTDASWAIGHPEKVIDFGNRGIHEMTSTAKSVIDAYYGKSPDHSYFAACSDGGREALMEAQRFPDDYDGILAGAPAYYWTNMVATGMQKVKIFTRSAGSYIPPAKIPAIASAVNAACDASDGVKDGILYDPRQCNFKPETLLCKSAESDACLTQPQIDSLKTIYAPTLDSAGKELYPGTLPGGEEGPGGWSLWLLGSAPDKTLSYAFTTNYFKDMVYGNPQWDYKSFSLAEGLTAAVAKTAAALNATNPDLTPFSRRGGKLILYHGWNDPAISPLSTVEYYNKVKQTNPNAAAFVKLFMVPGMQHCYGGPGPSSFGQFGWRPGTGPDDTHHDIYLALEQWVEKGVAPEEVIAAKIEGDAKTPSKITMTRPLCAYPLVAKYKGTGDTSDAASFACRVP